MDFGGVGDKGKGCRVRLLNETQGLREHAALCDRDDHMLVSHGVAAQRRYERVAPVGTRVQNARELLAPVGNNVYDLGVIDALRQRVNYLRRDKNG